jgi:hypothetical protein
MNCSPRRDRLGPEILRLSTSGRIARSASLFVGSTSVCVTKVHSAGHSCSRLSQGACVRGQADWLPCISARRTRFYSRA